MKKLPAILLLTIYLLTQVASVCWYAYKPLSHAWFAMLQKDNKNDQLLTITIHKNELEELENEEGEIVIDGVLYDIEQLVVTGNDITLHLEKDEGETKWKDHYSKINSLLHKQNHSKTATASKAPGIFLVFFYSKQNDKDLLIYNTKTNNYYPGTIQNHISPYPGLISPPPKAS
jgi:hypothetical protein